MQNNLPLCRLHSWINNKWTSRLAWWMSLMTKSNHTSRSRLRLSTSNGFCWKSQEEQSFKLTAYFLRLQVLRALEWGADLKVNTISSIIINFDWPKWLWLMGTKFCSIVILASIDNWLVNDWNECLNEAILYLNLNELGEKISNLLVKAIICLITSNKTHSTVAFW